MPPRKRRQSAQGEELSKESDERILSPSRIELEVTKQSKNTSKTPESGSVLPEKRLTARQLSKQDGAGEGVTTSKASKDVTQSTSSLETTAKQPTRFSTRIVKRPRRDLSPPESPIKKGKKAAVQPVVTTPETKGKRQWELWSVEDKDSFFEGLCEFGKDFESIHNLIVNKCKKKGNVLQNITVKNKEQVRHFYYRTWHKISKLIEPVENLKKDIQELYGLISYSTLRKKLRGGVNPNDKNWQKLNDLVHQGVATIKVKGKRIRVKTPVCNALKKLNSYEESRREPGPKVPEKIRVEFRPKTNIAWQQVQDLSHNPRVRVTVRSDRHLNSLVKYLEQKWKPNRLKLRESLGDGETSRIEFRVFPHRNSTLRSISMEAIDEPTLQFCLNKHSKDSANCSPVASKKKKDKDQCSSVKTNTENVDTSKSVISELNCLCKQSCNSCAFKQMKSCGFSNDLMKSCVGKDGTLNCSCLCNIGSRNNSPVIDKGSVDKKAVGSGPDHYKDPPARSLFGSSVESPVLQSPGDVSESQCVLSQKDSPVCRSDEVSTLPFARSISGQEVSAIADGENAMFPDSITKLCGDSVQDGGGSDVDIKDEDVNSEDGRESLGFTQENAVDNELKDEDDFTPNVSSQADFEKVFRGMLDTGWNVKESESVTLAELYLMFGEEGEMKLEYEWISQKTEVDILHEKFLNNLNNMLRRLSHLATIEFTDLKTPGSNVCQSCGQSPNPKKSQGRGKDKSPPVTVKVTKAKDVSTQTQGCIFNTPNPLGPGTSTQNGVFRIPVMPAPIASQPKTTTTVIQPSKELLARYNTSTTTTQKQLMRPRRLKNTSRSRPGTTNSLVQRTILPKNSEYITIIPMVPGAQIPTGSPDKGTVETIVGHPINGIQKHPVNTPPLSPITTAGSRIPISQATTVTASPVMNPGVHTPSSVPINMMEMSLSPDGDQTLLRIPASHLSTMSKEALKAAGFSTMPGTPLSSSISVGMDDSSSSIGMTTSTPVSTSACSTSPPNLSSLLLDMSLPSGDIDSDTTFSGLLDESSKTLTLDPVLMTPPIRGATDPRKTSPPVRSLFRSSPTPDSQWLGADVNDLSLSSFLESPSKPSTSSTAAMFNPNLPLSLFNENSREFHSHRMDVDTTFQSMMNESSIDYMKKFADLAEQITQSDPADQTKKPD